MSIDVELPTREVVAFSTAYFELLTARPELAPYFAVHGRLVVVLDKEVFRVLSAERPTR